MHIRRRVAAVLCAAGLSGAAGADTITLDPLVVTAPRVERELRRTPQAVGVVEAEDLQQGRQGLQLDESLDRIPGLFLQNRYNFAQNQRISIRGFGARAPFGIRGIRLLLDGIPETLPDGQSQVDMVDLESVDRIEVIRGPSSALYGNATGGVLDIRTMAGPPSPYAELRATTGSHDFRRVGVLAGGEQGAWNYHLSAWDLKYDGFREQSETEKRLVNTGVRYAFTPERSLTTLFTALDQPLGQDPGGLTRDQVKANRRRADPNAVALDAGQRVEQQRLGFRYRDTDLRGGTFGARIFYTRRDFRQQLPFPGQSLLGFDRDFYGVGLDYGNRLQGLAVPVRYLLGVEVDEQRDDRERFGVNPAGEVTGQTQREAQRATAAGIFGQVEIAFTPRLEGTFAARLDRMRFRIGDRLRLDGDQSGSRRFDEMSGSVGLSYGLTPDHVLYGTLGTAYETPTFTEFARAGGRGGFNPQIEPQRAVNGELGIKGSLGAATRYDLAVFAVRTRDEIVNIQTDENLFANAGRTRRHGLELGVDHFLTDRLALRGAWTASDFRFRDFETAEGRDLAGKRLPGLPKHALFGEIAWREPGGAYAMLDLLIVSRVFADNANEEGVAGYGLLNGRVGTLWHGRRSSMEAFVAVNNLLNREYFSNIRVNANNARYFEPAPGRNFFAGVRMRF